MSAEVSTKDLHRDDGSDWFWIGLFCGFGGGFIAGSWAVIDIFQRVSG